MSSTVKVLEVYQLAVEVSNTVWASVKYKHNNRG